MKAEVQFSALKRGSIIIIQDYSYQGEAPNVPTAFQGFMEQ